MPTPRDFLVGPWRAVTVLGVTEILSWGAIFYPPVLTVPLIAADHGWSKAFTMGGFSVGLFVGGLVSRYVGGAIDRPATPELESVVSGVGALVPTRPDVVISEVYVVPVTTAESG